MCLMLMFDHALSFPHLMAMIGRSLQEPDILELPVHRVLLGPVERPSPSDRLDNESSIPEMMYFLRVHHVAP